MTATSTNWKSPGFAHEAIEGWVPSLAPDEDLRSALEKAFDYRGAITITRRDGSKVEGYVFDRRTDRRHRRNSARLRRPHSPQDSTPS